MAFTPENTIIVRSVEYGDGSEYDVHSSVDELIPDHYVKRLWRKKVGNSIHFTNKDVAERSILYIAQDNEGKLTIKGGTKDEEGIIACVEWAPGSGKALEKSRMTIGSKTATLKDLIKRNGLLSLSRVFTGPDGLEYKWKLMLVGNDPAFPETTFRTLYTKGSSHPVATTARLAARDGNGNDETYPVYIAERGLRIQGWIIATLCIVERLKT